MWKSVMAGTAALAILGGSLALAQQPGTPDGPRWRPTAEDASAFADARIAALKAGLRLTPEQEKNWPPLEQAMRDMAKQRFDRMSAWRNQPRPTDPIERLRRGADAMGESAANMKRLADAAGVLYQSLDESQKRRFVMLARFMGPGHHTPYHRDHHMQRQQ